MTIMYSDADKAFISFTEWFRYWYIEKGQLYGVLIHLMKMYELDRIEAPIDDLEWVRNNGYYIFIKPSDDGENLIVELKQVEQEEDSE